MPMRGTGSWAGRAAGLGAVVVAAGGVLAGCGGMDRLGVDHGLRKALGSGAAKTPVVARLVAYDSCSQLLDQVRTQALAEVGPYGLGGSAGERSVASGAVAVPNALAAPQAAASDAP